MKEQQIITIDDDYAILDDLFISLSGNIMLVCDNSIEYLKIRKYFMDLEAYLGKKIVIFNQFQPNPLYDSVVAGVNMFRTENCKMIIAVGGGSAMDVAKCIKLYANISSEDSYLKQEIVPNDILLIAVPTTAGTGSEATRFAVIYENGEKQSISHESCIPDYVIFDASALKTVPEYQRKATMLDALCHALESFWSVNATEESMEYSKLALEKILQFKDAYLANEDIGNREMLFAANIAGKAINITQTTAGHAMSYKITSLFHIAHGHAAALCVSKVWRYMLHHTNEGLGTSGKEHLNYIFQTIADTMKVNTPIDAVNKFDMLLDSLKLDVPIIKNEKDYDILKTSVNPIRLKNNPIKLDTDTIDILYHEIFS